jgi:TatA/E family protein of Tat protein translocase
VPGGIGGPELLIVFLVVLIVFGPTKIPEVARGIGKGLRELRRLTTDLQREINLADSERQRPPARRSPPRQVSDASEPAAVEPEEPERGAESASQDYEKIDEQVLDSPSPPPVRPDATGEEIKPDT